MLVEFLRLLQDSGVPDMVHIKDAIGVDSHWMIRVVSVRSIWIRLVLPDTIDDRKLVEGHVIVDLCLRLALPLRRS